MCINHRYFQGYSGHIDYIMPCSCLDKNSVPFTDFFLKIQMAFTMPHFYQPHSLFIRKLLLHILMNLQTNIRTYQDAHKCHLCVTARPDFGTVLSLFYFLTFLSTPFPIEHLCPAIQLHFLVRPNPHIVTFALFQLQRYTGCLI